MSARILYEHWTKSPSNCRLRFTSGVTNQLHISVDKGLQVGLWSSATGAKSCRDFCVSKNKKGYFTYTWLNNIICFILKIKCLLLKKEKKSIKIQI